MPARDGAGAGGPWPHLALLYNQLIFLEKEM
jgi:hypothetical protein